MIKPSVDTLNPDSLLSLSRMSACKSGCCSHLQMFVKWVNVDWKRSVLSSSRSCTASPWSVSSVWGRPSVSLLLRAAVSWSHDFFIIFFYILTLPHNYITITSFSLLMPFMTAIAVAGGVMIHVEKAISLKLLNKVINNKVLNKHRSPHVSIWDPVLQFDQFGIVLFFQNVKLKERFTVLFPDNNTFLSAGLFKSTEHQDWFKCCCKPYFIIYQNWLAEPYREGVCVCWDQKLFQRDPELSSVFEDQPADVFVAAQVQIQVSPSVHTTWKRLSHPARDIGHIYTQHIKSFYLFTSCETQEFGPTFIFFNRFLSSETN